MYDGLISEWGDCQDDEQCSELAWRVNIRVHELVPTTVQHQTRCYISDVDTLLGHRWVRETVIEIDVAPMGLLKPLYTVRIDRSGTKILRKEA